MATPTSSIPFDNRSDVYAAARATIAFDMEASDIWLGCDFACRARVALDWLLDWLRCAAGGKTWCLAVLQGRLGGRRRWICA